MITSRIVRAGDAFLIEINGERLAPCGYMTYQPPKADYKMFREAGYRILFVPVYAGDRGINAGSAIRPFMPGFWKAEDEFDFSAVEAVFREAVGNAKPGEVYLIPRLTLEPPSFWEKAHPEELARDYSGMSVHQSYASKVWMDDTERVMERFQKWIEDAGWNDYIAGWHLAGGNTEEFLRPQTYEHQLADYSAVSEKAWQKWLCEKYGNIGALNAAWGCEYADFDRIGVPTPAQRTYAGENGEFCAAVQDYNRYFSVEVANAINELARRAKRILGGNRIVGAFYGYLTPERGHAASDVVYNDDAVDFLACPFSYAFNRALGKDLILGAAVDSAALHGKPWFIEADIRTFLSRPISEAMPFANPVGNSRYDGPVWWGPDTEDKSLAQMEKAFAKALTCGRALWWFDMWGGWYRSKKLAAFTKLTRELMQENYTENYTADSQTALFLDESVRGVCPKADPNQALVNMAYTGAAFSQFLLADLPNVDADKYRACVFDYCVNWTPELAKALEKWLRAGKSVIFLDGKRPEIEKKPITAAETDFGRVEVYADAQIYEMSGKPTPEALRECLLMAGVHIYSFTNDAVYAGGGYAVIHAASDGEKRLYLPFKGWLEDVLTGEKLTPCDHFTDFSMKSGETRFFRTHRT